MAEQAAKVERHSIPCAVWRAVRRRDGRVCRYCGITTDPIGARRKAMWRRMRALTYDHIVPVLLEGENTVDNIVVACRKCNLEKGARTRGRYVRPLIPVPEQTGVAA